MHIPAVTEVKSEDIDKNMNNNNNGDSDDNIPNDYFFTTAFETQPQREETSFNKDILEVLNNLVNDASVGGRRNGTTSRRVGDTSLELVGETVDGILESLNTSVKNSVGAVQTVRVS